MIALWHLFYAISLNVVVQAISLVFALFLLITHNLFASVCLLSVSVSSFSVYIEAIVQKQLTSNRLYSRYIEHRDQIVNNFSGRARTVYIIGLIKIFPRGLAYEFARNLSLIFKICLFIPAFIYLDLELPRSGLLAWGDLILGIDPFSIYRKMGFNVLPLIMFALSMASGALIIKNKQEFMKHAGMSLFFFALLYQEKSILVIYWSMNIILSTLILLVLKDLHFTRTQLAISNKLSRT